MRVRYGSAEVVCGASLEVAAGEVVALVGASGAGKSTLLRCFNRMVDAESGRITVAGTDVRALDPYALRRRLGYVPQDGGLLPHWTILRNVALAPRLVGQPDADGAAQRALALVGLSDPAMGSRLPHELSGGQRQRVALARALAADQRVLLLDEPFSALDRISRSELQELLRALRTLRPMTALLVTHDLHEAALLADTIAVMRDGVVEQSGTLGELLDAPTSPYVNALLAPLRVSA